MHLIIQSKKPISSWLDNLVGFLSSLGINAAPQQALIQSSPTHEDYQAVRFDSFLNPLPSALQVQLPIYCANQGLDWAWLPQLYTRSEIGLLSFDMDSTLITIECIDEIADYLGIKEQVANITRAAMRGELDFATSLRARVRLLAGAPVDALTFIYENRLKFSPGAESLLGIAKNLGIKTLLVSGGFTFFTERLKKNLNIDFAVANQLEVVDNKLTGEIEGTLIDGPAKAYWLEKIRREHCTPKQITVAIGDGANDIPMLQAAHLGIAYRAKPIVQAQVNAVINHGGLDAAFSFFPER